MNRYSATVDITYHDGTNTYQVAQITGSSLYFRELMPASLGTNGLLTITIDDRAETHSVTLTHRSHKCYGYTRHDTPMGRIAGKWPGDETDGEIEDALRRLS